MTGAIESVSFSEVALFPQQAPRARRRDLIRALDDIGAGDAPLVGGKVHPLGALRRKGFCIPDGFCVTTEAFRQSRCGDDICLPPQLREMLVEVWRRSGFATAAVRSSATEEDGRDTSWAGVFPTVLPVRNADEMIAAVETCFRALHAPEAEFLRARVIGNKPPAMAVLVQELVDAQASGIVFTANPVTGARGEIVINATRGLGEPLASGRVNGDVIVAGRDGAIRSETVTDQTFMLTSAGPVALAPTRAKKPAVTRAQAKALVGLAVEIEALFGCPQDIEFAIRGGRIHVIQARPITGADRASIGEDEVESYLETTRAQLANRVASLRRQGQLEGRRAIFSNGNIGELLPTPTPMSFGLFRAIFAGPGAAIATGRRKLGYVLEQDAAEPLYELICGQPYFNVEIDAKTFRIGPEIEVDDILDRIAREPGRASYPEFGLYAQGLSLDEAQARHGAEEGRKRHDAFWRFHAAMRKAAGDMLRRRESDERAWLRALEPPRRDEIDGSENDLLAAFQQRLDRLRQNLCVDFVMAARIAFFFADLVRWRLQCHFGDDGLTGDLLKGLDGSMVTRQAFDLEGLARGRIGLHAFLSSHGHCAANELEISLPRLAEDPQAVDKLLRELTASGRRPGAEFREQQRQRRATQRAVRRQLAARGASEDEIRALFADLRLAQAFLPLRETNKHCYTGEYRALRDILLEINRRLGWADGDIFYLEPGELDDGFETPEAFAPLVRARRRERKIAALLAAQRRVPAVVSAEALHRLGARAKTAAGGLKGAPVAPGAVVGRVMLLDEGASGPPHGSCRERIIVTRSANLGLAPLLRVAAGLIVEVGGVLAHAACQARESGVPALVLEGATSLLRDGALVSLDGATGRVEILEAPQ
ncbi:hypothetical protein CCR94_04560 [Rhodoblastus sphagnicola]|uniref:Phosphoenolpyruvate synthase n=1 Tax=Rhodoblastus sphagnicola TaxID=333368 RepID=A0A2S6NDJ3_9HYPH|nr:PEP/pyruvate-binding domain-containing protein [Rhodoblastus sphagnicola]MBB4200078.1 pyruvate,water dikinase [Rhodoblastus sphagnicola]PPQ32692.1 hypothetical protein CCR94_04560 [Rhodoblastus sphagnicola]